MRLILLASVPLLLAATPGGASAETTGFQPAPVPGGVLPKVGRRGVGQANPGSPASEASGPTYSTPFSGTPSPSEAPANAAAPAGTVELPGAHPSPRP